MVYHKVYILNDILIPESSFILAILGCFNDACYRTL